MGELMVVPDPANRELRQPRRATAIGVVGEVFITLGILVFLFLGWKVWLNDIIVGNEQTVAAGQLAEQWAGTTATPTPTATSTPTATPTPGASTSPTAAPTVPSQAEPVVAKAPAENLAFANLIVPRLGSEYRRTIGEGTGLKVLNSNRLGIGHYAQTQMPGAVGNFALAAHRSAFGGAFHNINELVIGDSIYVETKDGWYRYVYRSTEYVRASGIGVLSAVPQVTRAKPADRIITLTSCHPFYSTNERIIAYGVFVEWFPRAGGPPAEIASVVNAEG